MRNAAQLAYAGETADSLRRELDRLDEEKAAYGATEEGAKRWIQRREDLAHELAIITGRERT